jgi:hypothetical protein
MKTLRVLKYVSFGILGFGFLIAVIFGVQALWNWLIPELFNGPVLTYWQTAGLIVLSKILLTGIAPGGSHSHGNREWRKKYHSKFRSGYCNDEVENATEKV